MGAASRKGSAVPLPTTGWFTVTSKQGALHGVSVARLLRLLGSLALIPIVMGLGKDETVVAPLQTPSAVILVLDVSSSMTAEDFAPDNRLERAKSALEEFVLRNRQSELGLIVFAASPQLLVPLTMDHATLLRSLRTVRPAGYGQDGTAIGSGVSSAVNRLRSGSWPAKSVLLVTDGVNNRGAVSPLDAARLARMLDVRLHAIGIGTDAVSRFYVPSPTGESIGIRARIEIDDEALVALTRESGGSYSRVTNTDELRQALLQDPVQPEEVKKEVTSRNLNPSRLLALLSLLFLSAEFVLLHVLLSEIPGWTA